MKLDQEVGKRKSISFTQFKSYCQKLVHILNDPQTVEKQNTISHKDTNKQVISYKASYKILNRKFARQHDCEYLEIQQLSQICYPSKSQQENSQQNNKETLLINGSKINIDKKRKVLLKINITYSISYQIPLLMFMPYHLVQSQQQKDENDKYKNNQQQQPTSIQLIPFNKQQISLIINKTIGSQKLQPSQDQTGVFIIQNHINKEYFYTLHHCYMDTYQMNVDQIIPYYLAIVGCHQPILL